MQNGAIALKEALSIGTAFALTRLVLLGGLAFSLVLLLPSFCGLAVLAGSACLSLATDQVVNSAEFLVPSAVATGTSTANPAAVPVHAVVLTVSKSTSHIGEWGVRQSVK